MVQIPYLIAAHLAGFAGVKGYQPGNSEVAIVACEASVDSGDAGPLSDVVSEVEHSLAEVF